MICGACNTTITDFSALPRVGRTHGLEVRTCGCGAPVAQAVQRRQRPAAQLITASSAKCFRSCPRKYRHSYVTGLRPLVDAPALRFGTLWHHSMEAWWQRREWTVPSDADPFDLARCQALLAGYSARWSLDGFEVVSIEQPFQAPLLDSAGKRVRGWAVAGKVDGIVRQDGRALLLEHKTTSDDVTAGGDYWARLALDSQISIYFAGAAALGHQVEGCLYDVVRKLGLRVGGAVALLDAEGLKIVLDAQGQRVLTKTGTPRQTGDSSQGYALQTREETPAEHQARCLELLAERPNEHFARATIVRLDGELAAARDDLVATVRQIEWCAKHAAWPRNDGHCFEFGRCQYFGLCTGTGSEQDFRRVEDTHPELSV